ncbi:hypothetical protein JCM30237_24710 [Halolamina litorea]|uniref:CBS domain-containing protein n=1 Tax=Halolamina litorea TaxID=1515593 RepID=A0ABD6BTK5_9EURY|nr:hypothetical protein [Halolamina litorea]
MRGSSTCTAGAIATPDPAGQYASESVKSVAAWLESRDFDTAPVYDGDEPMGYVTDDLLDGVGDDDRPVAELCHPLDVGVIMSPDTGFERLLSALYESRSTAVKAECLGA